MADRVLFSKPAPPDVKTEREPDKIDFIKLGYPDKPTVPPSPEDRAYLDNKNLKVGLSAEFANTSFTNFLMGEHVQLIFSGTAGDGKAVTWSTAYTVSSREDTRELYVPANKVKALAGQVATIKYVVSSTDAQGARKVRTSQSVCFEVRGISLPEPKLVEAIGNTIDPDQISRKAKLSYITVQLDYPGMAVGDTVRLVREGMDSNQKAINFTDKDRPISASNLQRRPMTITWTDTDIKPLINGVMTIYYKVYRNGIWYTSPRRTFSVGPSLAGRPPFINEVSNARLDPDLIADSVNLHIPSAGTIVGDKITILWSDTSKQTFTDEAVVTQQNVDGDLSFDIYLDNPIDLNRGKVVTVFYVLERTLPDGKKATYRSGDYKFFVGNQADKEAVDGRQLTIPLIAGVQNGVMEKNLTNTGADLVVPFAETQEGDSVTAYWQVVGEAKPTALEAKTVDSANVDADLSFAIPAALIKSALGKKVIGYYVITRKGLDGKPKQFRSAPLPFSVGPLTSTGQLPAPFVPMAKAGLIDPMNGVSGTVVKVAPYPTIAVGDRVKVFWIGSDGAGTPDVAPQFVSDITKTLEFKVPATAIGASIGYEEVWIYYEVTHAYQTNPIESDDTVVGIDLLGHDDLPAPIVDQAVGGTLDLGSAKGEISVSIKKWPFIAAGQRIWLRIEGVGRDENPVQVAIWVARALSADDAKNGVKVIVDRSKLVDFKDGSVLKVFALINHDGDFNDEYCEEFPVTTVNLKQVKQSGSGADASANSGALVSTVVEVSLWAAYPSDGSKGPAGSSSSLSISGGKAPYTYKSANPSVAEVDANGLIKARGNGNTYITVRDAYGQVIYVEVAVKGILEFVHTSFDIFARCNQFAVEADAEIPSLDMWKKLREEAGGTLKLPLYQGKPSLVWTSSQGKTAWGFTKRIAFVMPDFNQNPDTAIRELDDKNVLGVKMGDTAHGFPIKKR